MTGRIMLLLNFVDIAISIQLKLVKLYDFINENYVSKKN